MMGLESQPGAGFCGVLQSMESTLDFCLSSQDGSYWSILSRGVKYSGLCFKRYTPVAGKMIIREQM